MVHMRVRMDNAMKIIMAGVVLHNIGIDWRDEAPEARDAVQPDDQPQDHIDQYQPPAHYNNMSRVERRRLGQQARDNLRSQMNPQATNG